MLRTTYVSRATRPMTDADLDEILAGSRDHNAEHGLTGLLVYAEGRFFQTVEGEASDVLAVMERVRRSRRHTDVRQAPPVLQQARQFPQWTMGFDVTAPRALVDLVLTPLVTAGLLTQDEADAVLWARFATGVSRVPDGPVRAS